MHSLDVLEYETRRVDIWQINSVNHARRIVARLQYVVNGKPSVSNVLSLGVPQLYVDGKVAVSSRERARRLDRTVGEGFKPKGFGIQAVAFRSSSEVGDQRGREVGMGNSIRRCGHSSGFAEGCAWCSRSGPYAATTLLTTKIAA